MPTNEIYKQCLEEKSSPFWLNDTKSLRTVLKNKNVYHINNAIKLGNYNVGREEEVLTIPLYMGFLIKDSMADVIVPDIDLSLLT